MSNPTYKRAVEFIKNFGANGTAVYIKSDGSVPAFLNPTSEGWDEEWLYDYLGGEVKFPNFQDSLRKKGSASIFLVGDQAASVLHVRVMEHSRDFHYVD